MGSFHLGSLGRMWGGGRGGETGNLPRQGPGHMHSKAELESVNK